MLQLGLAHCVSAWRGHRAVRYIHAHRLPETLHAADDAALAPDATTGAGTPAVRARIGPYMPMIDFGIWFCSRAGRSVPTSLDYMTTYALNTLHLPANVSFGVVVVTSICAMIF